MESETKESAWNSAAEGFAKALQEQPRTVEMRSDFIRGCCRKPLPFIPPLARYPQGGAERPSDHCSPPMKLEVRLVSDVTFQYPASVLPPKYRDLPLIQLDGRGGTVRAFLNQVCGFHSSMFPHVTFPRGCIPSCAPGRFFMIYF